ncbi:MAG: NUDIX hydrolase [Dehalococcoidia bacterium]
MSNAQERHERVLESRYLYRGHVLNLRLDTIAMPSGHVASREVVEHSQTVAIVPRDEEGNLLLVRQYRLPAQRALLEIPAGGVDAGETAAEAVQRELQEETGYRAREIRRLGGFYVAPGYCSEYIHVFLATGLEPSRLAADADEELELVRMPLEEALALVRRGEIEDAKSIIGLLLAARQSS